MFQLIAEVLVIWFKYHRFRVVKKLFYQLRVIFKILALVLFNSLTWTPCQRTIGVPWGDLRFLLAPCGRLAIRTNPLIYLTEQGRPLICRESLQTLQKMAATEQPAAVEKREDVENSKKKPPSSFKSFIAGGVGGVCLVASGHPLDTIKVSRNKNHFREYALLTFRPFSASSMLKVQSPRPTLGWLSKTSLQKWKTFALLPKT